MDKAVTIKMDREKARQLYDSYRAAVRNPEDDAIMAGYKALANGKMLLDLVASMKLAGMDERRRPRLAIARAHWQEAYFCGSNNGSGVFSMKRTYVSKRWNRFTVKLPSATFTNPTWELCRARMPLVPAPLRPAKRLSDYFVLWEAEWQDVPKDPMLLKHLAGGLYIVLATWDLTELEQAVLRGRIT